MKSKVVSVLFLITLTNISIASENANNCLEMAKQECHPNSIMLNYNKEGSGLPYSRHPYFCFSKSDNSVLYFKNINNGVVRAFHLLDNHKNKDCIKKTLPGVVANSVDVENWANSANVCLSMPGQFDSKLNCFNVNPTTTTNAVVQNSNLNQNQQYNSHTDLSSAPAYSGQSDSSAIRINPLEAYGAYKAAQWLFGSNNSSKTSTTTSNNYGNNRKETRTSTHTYRSSTAPSNSTYTRSSSTYSSRGGRR